MAHPDKKLPSNPERLKEIAKDTDNPQLKRAIEKRLKGMSEDNEVRKHG